MKRKRILIVVLIIGILIGVGAFLTIDHFYGVYGKVVLEAGGNITAKDFMKNPNVQASFVEGTQFDTSVPGSYSVRIKAGLFTSNSLLVVQDTIAPTVVPKEVMIPFHEKASPEQFVSDIVDSTAVTVSFVSEPDWDLLSPQTVEISVTDLGGNITKVSSMLTISPIFDEITVEAGSEFPSVTDFLLADCDAVIQSDTKAVDMTALKDYPVEILVGQNVFTSILHIVDTTAPVFGLSEQTVYQGVPVCAEQFVDSVFDNSQNITYEFVNDIDTMTPGTVTVEVCASDESGNSSVQKTEMTILEDMEAPAFRGLADRVVFIGDSFSYRNGVSVSDNSGVELMYDIEASSVNLSEEGTYTVTYTATDCAGNEAVASILLTVKTHEYTLEQVNELADGILAKIITDDMSSYEKCDAIYKWVRRNIGYISHSDKEDYLKSAYEGFVRKQGDCYTYFAVSKVLLTQAGIENRDIEKIPAKSRHYWNLVNIGDGWYHFDTTPRTSGGEFFMLTDEQLMSYSSIHSGSHNYDPESYTDVEWGTSEYHDFNPYYSKKKEESEETTVVEGTAGETPVETPPSE